MYHKSQNASYGNDNFKDIPRIWDGQGAWLMVFAHTGITPNRNTPLQPSLALLLCGHRSHRSGQNKKNAMSGNWRIRIDPAAHSHCNPATHARFKVARDSRWRSPSAQANLRGCGKAVRSVENFDSMAAYGRTAGIADFHHIRRQHPRCGRCRHIFSSNQDLTTWWPLQCIATGRYRPLLPLTVRRSMSAVQSSRSVFAGGRTYTDWR